MKDNDISIASELKESNQRLLEAQKLAKIGNWEANVDTGNIYWSPVVYEIFELDPKNFKPTINSFKEMVHSDDEAMVYEEDINAFKSGEFSLTHRIITKKGNIKYVQQTASKIDDKNKLIYRGTIQDVTKLKKTENALKEEKKRLDLIISSSSLGTYDWHREKKCYVINDYYANILGYKKKELPDITMEKWMELVHPDDMAFMTDHFFKNKNEAIIRYDFEIRLKHKKGHWVWVLNNGRVEGLTKDLKPIDQSGIILEISERKIAEIELDRTKALLQQTNLITKTGGWTWNIETGQIYWTENTRNIYEMPEDYDPNINGVFDFIEDKTQVESSKQLIENAINKQEKYDLQLRLISGKGNPFWARIIGVPEIENGKLIRYYGTIQNIEEQKQNEFKLQEKTKQYNELVENIPIGVYKLNRNGELNYMSPPFKSIIGIGERNIDTNDFAKEIVHPDDLEMFLKANNYALENYQYFNLEFRIIAKGQTKWVKATSQPNKDIDGNWYWFGTLSDINYRKNTELKVQENEKQLQNIITSMSEALLFYDEEGIIRSMNDSAAQILDLNKSDIVGNKLAKTIIKLLDDKGNELKSNQHPVAIALKEKKSFNDVRVQLLNAKTNKTIWIAANIKIIDEKDTHWALVTFNNITDRVKSEKQLIEAKKVAEDANKAKSTFLANMSHEIRTPLNGVIGFSDLLRKTNLNNLQTDYTKHIYNSAHSLLGIINDILDFSKIEAGKLNLQYEKINGLKLVESASAFITYQTSQKGLELVIDYQKEAPHFFQADELRLRQILINLLGNAVKFTEKGTILLRVSTVKKSNKLRIEVMDTGIGISKEQQKNIFSAFEQADVSTTRKFGGSGLGLTISNKLLKMMGSKLKLKSEPKQGSNFYFDIELDEKEISKERWTDNITFNIIRKVLLVDDNSILNESLRDFLEMFGLEVLVKSSAIEAHKTIKDNENFDLIIIDEEMDNIDGLELLEMLKEKELIHNTPIIILHKHIDSKIFISQYADDENIYKVPKPVVNSELIETIECIEKGVKNKDDHQTKKAEEGMDEGSLKLNKILVAEDNEVNKFLITRILENVLPDCELLHAENGEIAVDKYKKDKPDLILMDIQMPIMSGIEATEIIRAYEKSGERIPIIALSAGVLKEEKENALNVGIDDFLEKPLIQEDFINTLKKLKIEGKIKEAQQQEIKKNIQKFNKQDLLKRLNHNEKHYLSFINLAKENMLTFERQLNETIETENIQALRSVLHKLKGTALAGCFENLALLINQFDRPSFYNQKVSNYMRSKIIPELHKLMDILDKEVK
ncbi:PAS domain-containing protein [Marivirga sp.]|uniref:PAS domain-containing protein n=1 Tax=Marivirga sp. TaxID=2018662 RepID=UPI003DA78B91